MPAPTTTDEFLDLVRKSGVVEEKRLATHLDSLRASSQMPAEPVRLAAQLVRDGVLTHFQAEQFLQGKWRRFTIGKYKVLERLGSGGMGSVYLCEHMLMRRRVAVKVLPAAKAEDSSSLERFYREARAVAALDHPNIVRAYDIDQDDNLHFLVMEHVDGSSLQEIIRRTGGMDVLRTAHYIRQAALGLQHAHETAALVHRDIKPGNILVDRNGIVKVLDMGLARFFHDEEDVLTKKYDENVLGTADYLAPEQALDSHAVDIRADIYSLGATFYFCLTGRTPFAEGTVAQKLIWHQTRAPKPIRSFRPEVPEGIVAVIDRMMAKDPNQRYQSPQEVADALEPWTQTPIPPPPDNEMPQFSLAATRALCETGANSLTSKPASDSSRKPWQVSGSASQVATATAPVTTATPAPRETRPTAAPAPVPVAVAPAPVARAPVAAAPITAPARAEARVEARAAAPVVAPIQMELPAVAPRANGNGAIRASKPAAVAEPAEETEKETEDEEAPFRTAERRPREGQRRSRDKAGRSPILWIVLGAAFLIALPLGGLVVYLLTRSGPDTRANPAPQKEPIRVGPNYPGGLALALRRARTGDRILLEVDIHEMNLAATVANVTIEPAPGKKIVWKCPGKAPDKQTKLLTISAANVTLRGISLDGDNQTESLIAVYGKCPGVKLENLQLRNSREFGVLFANCEGSSDDHVTLSDVEFTTTPTQTAIRFIVLDHHKTIRKNRFISLRNCTFNGPGKKLTTPNPGFIDESTLSLPKDVKVVVQP